MPHNHYIPDPKKFNPLKFPLRRHLYIRKVRYLCVAMKRIDIWGEPSARQLEEIADALRSGQLIVYPTDSLYALGCDSMSKDGVEALCRIKGINAEKSPLSLVCSDISMASEYARIDNTAFRLLKANTPGPFTFLLGGSSRQPRTLRGRRTIGIRIPDNATARALASALGHPLLSTSLDYTAEMAGYDPETVCADYSGRVAMLLAEGELAAEPSTVIDLTGPEPEIVRQGKGVVR